MKFLHVLTELGQPKLEAFGQVSGEYSGWGVHFYSFFLSMDQRCLRKKGFAKFAHVRAVTDAQLLMRLQEDIYGNTNVVELTSDLPLGDRYQIFNAGQKRRKQQQQQQQQLQHMHC